MFPKVHLRIISTLGKWILLAPKPIKINGKRGSFSRQKNLLTNLREEFYSVHFKERGPRVPDKCPLEIGHIADMWQGSVAGTHLPCIVQPKKGILLKDFLHQ